MASSTGVNPSQSCGFTLIELIIVLAVIAILAVAGTMTVKANIDRARLSDAVRFVEKELVISFVGCRLKNLDYTVCLRADGDTTGEGSPLLGEGAPVLTVFETQWTNTAPDAAGTGATTILTIPTPTGDVAADLVTRLQASLVPHIDNPANVGFDTDAEVVNETDVTVTLYLP